jgi:hypothetical protein
VSITTDTLGDLGKTKKGKNIIINNGANAINITVNGGTNFNQFQRWFRCYYILAEVNIGSNRWNKCSFNGIAGSTAIVTSFRYSRLFKNIKCIINK